METPLALKSRPGWVWIISIWYTGGFLVTIRLIFVALSGHLSLTPQGKAILAKMTASDYAFMILQSLLLEFAVIALFFLRKQATYLFWSAFVIALTSNVYQFIFNHQLGMNRVWYSLVCLLVVCVYCQNLERKDTLT